MYFCSGRKLRLTSVKYGCFLVTLLLFTHFYSTRNFERTSHFENKHRDKYSNLSKIATPEDDEYIKNAVKDQIIHEKLLTITTSNGQTFKFAKWTHPSVDVIEWLGTAKTFFEVSTKRSRIWKTPKYHVV